MNWDDILATITGWWHAFLDLFAPVLGVLALTAAFIVSPFVNLFYPALPEFVPEPEPPPPAVEKHSIADYIIVYAADAAVTEISAANVLADTLSRITGDAWAASPATAPAGAKEILVGKISGLDVSALGDDGYSIRAQGDNILISGGQRGVLYGAYRFLERYFCCHWYTHELQVIPPNPGAMIAEVEAEAYAPALEYREMDWLSRSDPTYSVANGLNGNIYRTLSPEQGGTFGYNGSFAHTIINQFVRPGDFFAAHPDWYAWRDDVRDRVPRQLCLTNPEVLAEMIREVRQYLGNGSGQNIISVTQDDNQDYCQCAECKRVDAEEGSQAGTMLRFVNAIADDIKDDYPNAAIDTFAYQYTRTPPKYVKPLPNVIVRLCSIECCFAHPLDDPKCSFNAAFARDIEAWSEICDRLYIWDYTTDYAHYLCLFPNFGVLQKNMQFFVKYHARGIYEEGNYASHESNGEFAELRGYLIARLLFNPDIDYDAEMNGFLKAYYGGGWQYIREFIDFACANAGTKIIHRKLGIFNDPTDRDLLRMGPNKVRYADALWEKAIELAGDGYAGAETYEQHVRRSQLSWRFWKGANRKGEFSRLQPVEQWQAANEALYHDYKAFGITRYREGWSDTSFGWRFLPEPPDSWWGTPMDWRG